ncbi:MAG: hypothetical protein AABW68_04540 [archaeon]
MKIYSHALLGDIPLEKIGIALLILGGIALLLFLGLPNGIHSPISATLQPNPISLGKEESALLHVILTNPTNIPQENVKITTQTLGTDQLSLFPAHHTIAALGPQETREVDFLILPMDTEARPFVPGNYRIDIQTIIEGKTYALNVFVTVTK